MGQGLYFVNFDSMNVTINQVNYNIFTHRTIT